MFRKDRTEVRRTAFRNAEVACAAATRPAIDEAVARANARLSDPSTNDLVVETYTDGGRPSPTYTDGGRPSPTSR